MEKPEETVMKFMKKFARRIVKEAPSSSDKEIKRFFHGILANLPNGDLLATLRKSKKECLQLLIRLVKKAVRKQEIKKTKSAAQKDVTAAQKDVRVQHKAPHVDTNGDSIAIPASPQHIQSATSSDQHASEVLQQIVQLLQSGKYDTEMGTQIDRLWLQMQEVGSQKTLVADGDKHCVMLTMTYRHTDTSDSDTQIMRNVMQHYFSSLITDLQSIQNTNPAKSIKRAQKKLKPLVQFLKMCHLRHLYVVEDAAGAPSYVDLAMALLSIYLDLFIITHRETEVTKKEQRRMTNLVKNMAMGVGEKSLDITLQMTTADGDKTYERTAYFVPLIRYLLREKPAEKSHSHYLRYVLTASWWRHLWTDLEDVVAEVRTVRAPKGILTWLKRRKPEVLEHLPTDRKFKRRAVTAFLLDDADEKLIEMLKYALVAEEETGGATDEDEAAEGGEQIENGREAVISKKKSKKKKKTATIAEKEELGSDNEDNTLFAIDRGSCKETADVISESQPDDAVEVFDWTNLTETAEPTASDLFIIDRGGKRPSDMVVTEASKKKKKKRNSEVTQLPAAQEKIDSIPEDAPFFIDRGQKKKTKRQSVVHTEESKSEQQKMKKKRAKKIKDGDNERNDNDTTGVTSAEISVEMSANPGTFQSTAAWQEPKEKNQTNGDRKRTPSASEEELSGKRKRKSSETDGDRKWAPSASEEELSGKRKRKSSEADGDRKRTPSASEEELSGKRKRKSSEAAPKAQSPVPETAPEADRPVLEEVKACSESSSYGSSWVGNKVAPRTSISSPQIADMAEDSQVVSFGTAEPGMVSQEEDERNDVSIVPDSFSEEDSNSEVIMVPDLNVHLKPKSPKSSPDKGTRHRATLSFSDSVISPAFNKSETCAAPPQPVTEAESAPGPEVGAETMGKVSRQKRKRSSVSLDAAEKEERPAAVEERESEELQVDLKKGESPIVEAKIEKATAEAKKVKSPVRPKEIKSPVEIRKMKSPVASNETKSPVMIKELKSPTETRRMKSPVDTKETKNPVKTKEMKSPVAARQSKNNKRLTEELEVETSGLKTRQSASSDSPQSGNKPKSKTPKSTTPVSRRTRLQRKSVIPTATQPHNATKTEIKPTAEPTSVVRSKSPVKASDAKTTAPKPSIEASKEPVSVSQNDSDTVQSRKSRRSHMPTTSDDTDKGAYIVLSESSDKSHRTSLPSRRTSSLITALQKKATRKPKAASLISSACATASEKELGKEVFSAEGSFTKLKLKRTAENPASPAKKGPKTSKRGSRKDAEEEVKAEKDGGEAKERELPSTPVKVPAARTSPQKSPSLSQASLSPDIQTRSQSLKKGYNLRMKSKQ